MGLGIDSLYIDTFLTVFSSRRPLALLQIKYIVPGQLTAYNDLIRPRKVFDRKVTIGFMVYIYNTITPAADNAPTLFRSTIMTQFSI
jgi:hypothetical protein